ncbi:MAG: ribonuclease Z [Chitinophagales bacterium]|nr:ribonuclease Z [Chitinophagales bacterium]
MRFEVLILGNSSATPAYGRHPTAQILRTSSQQFLIDCGEGTQMQFQSYGVKFRNLNTIFISHLHGDHFYGLIGLITSLNLNGRKKDLNIYGPEGLEEIIDTNISVSDLKLSFELKFHLLPEMSSVIYNDDEISVTAFPLIHRVATKGFLFRQNQKPLRIIPDKISEYSLSIDEIRSIKKGEDLNREGLKISNHELTKPAEKLKSYAFISDTLFSESYLEIIKNVTLLYHEATFPEELSVRARETYHSTARQAAEAAIKSKAEKLIIGHFSARYKSLETFLEEAQSVFPNTEIAEEGKTFEI